MERGSKNQFQKVFKEDAVWGEQEVIKFRWILIGVILIFIGYIYYSGESKRAFISLLLASIYIFYNSILNILLRNYGSAPWIRFLSATIDITTLSVHVFNYSFFFKPIAVTTAASTFLYPVLIMLAVLRYDKHLVLFSTAYSVVCFNVIYAIRSPHIDTALFQQVASADWAGQIYKSSYFIVMGYFLYSVPQMIHRINNKHQSSIDQNRSTAQSLASEKQERKRALAQLQKERRLNIQLAEQKALIEDQKERLQKANATKDKLFSIIGHDLKSPTLAQNAIIELLLDNYDQHSKNEIKDVLQSIQHSSQQSLGLLENLLDWSKQQNKLVDVQPVPLCLHTLVNDTEKLLTHNIARKNIQLINQVDPNATVCADVNGVKTILRNIVANAIKYTNNDGTITVNSKRENGTYLLHINDNGVGMSQEQQKRLFNIYNNVSTPGTDNEPGTGLGLLLCKELAEQNNATIQIKSEEGKGSCFTLVFDA